MEPVHVQLNANDFKISVINASHRVLDDVKVTAKVINNDMRVAWQHSQQLPVSPDGMGMRGHAGRENRADDSPVGSGEYIYEIRGLARPLTSLYPFTLQI